MPKNSSALSGAAQGASMGSSIAPGWGTLIGGVAGLGYGLYQDSKAEKDKAIRPNYVIPKEVEDALSLSKLQALRGLPQPIQQQFIENYQRNTAGQMAELGTRKSGIAGLAAINQNEQDAVGKLMSANANASMQGEQNMLGQLGNVADHKQQAFQINQLNPYYEQEAKNQALKGASQQNIGNAVQLLASSMPQGKQGGQGLNQTPPQAQPDVNSPSMVDNTNPAQNLQTAQNSGAWRTPKKGVPVKQDENGVWFDADGNVTYEPTDPNPQ